MRRGKEKSGKTAARRPHRAGRGWQLSSRPVHRGGAEPTEAEKEEGREIDKAGDIPLTAILHRAISRQVKESDPLLRRRSVGSVGSGSGGIVSTAAERLRRLAGYPAQIIREMGQGWRRCDCFLCRLHPVAAAGDLASCGAIGKGGEGVVRSWEKKKTRASAAQSVRCLLWSLLLLVVVLCLVLPVSADSLRCLFAPPGGGQILYLPGIENWQYSY